MRQHETGRWTKEVKLSWLIIATKADGLGHCFNSKATTTKINRCPFNSGHSDINWFGHEGGMKSQVLGSFGVDTQINKAIMLHEQDNNDEWRDEDDV